MANERLRAAFLHASLTFDDAAAELGVDPKTIERWIGGRVPYRRYRYALAARLGLDETYLWPDALAPEQVASAAESEILTVYPHRWAVPRDIWGRVFDGAEQAIDILVYSGMFLADDGGLLSLFTRKAKAGVQIRILLGDPDSPAVIAHGHAEGVDDTLPAKVRNALVLFGTLKTVDGIEIRTHGTVLYNSIYRGDDDVLVNPHIYGAVASQAPVMYLRRVAGGDMVSTYIDSFDRVWATAQPLD